MQPHPNCVQSSGYASGTGYANNDLCTINNPPPLAIEVKAWSVEAHASCSYDFMSVNGAKYCGTTGPAGVVPDGTPIIFDADGGSTADGWEICFGTPTPSMPPSPPAAPPLPPAPPAPPSPPSPPVTPPAPPANPPSIVVTEGTYPADVKWTLLCEGVAPISGGAPYSGFVDARLDRQSCHLVMIGRSSPAGWNGATFSAFGESATLSGAMAAVQELGLKPPPAVPPALPSPPPLPPSPPHHPGSLVTITVVGGSYPSEVSWTLTCDDGATKSGGAPGTFTVIVSEGAVCTLDMADSFGDGWDSGSWNADTLGQGPYTVADGSSATARRVHLHLLR